MAAKPGAGAPRTGSHRRFFRSGRQRRWKSSPLQTLSREPTKPIIQLTGRYAAGQLCDWLGEMGFVIWESTQRGYADNVATSETKDHSEIVTSSQSAPTFPATSVTKKPSKKSSASRVPDNSTSSLEIMEPVQLLLTFSRRAHQTKLLGGQFETQSFAGISPRSNKRGIG